MSARPTAIGLTSGEESGIGPEVTVGAIALVRPRVPLKLCVGRGLVDWTARLLGEHGLAAADIELIEASGGPDGRVVPARPTKERTPLRAPAALQTLADLAVRGDIGAMLTGPVPKAIFAHLPSPPPGQTEYIAARQRTPGFAMLLAGPTLRVAPVTTHVRLRDVADLLTVADIVRVGRAVAFELSRSFGVAAPRLVVSGLNPHTGEQGRLGHEELTIIAPAVEALRGHGIDAAGPMSVDQAFPAALAGRFDAVVCMYHDQALGPLKAVHFGEAINFTCGLPVPRVSPDHGTAYDIAGRGEADVRSTVAALQQAVQSVSAAGVDSGRPGGPSPNASETRHAMP